MTAAETTFKARKSSNGPTTDNPIPSGGPGRGVQEVLSHLVKETEWNHHLIPSEFLQIQSTPLHQSALPLPLPRGPVHGALSTDSLPHSCLFLKVSRRIPPSCLPRTDSAASLHLGLPSRGRGLRLDEKRMKAFHSEAVSTEVPGAGTVFRTRIQSPSCG